MERHRLIYREGRKQSDSSYFVARVGQFAVTIKREQFKTTAVDPKIENSLQMSACGVSRVANQFSGSNN